MCTHQISERREVHADSEHTTGQSQLRQLCLSRRNQHTKIHPACTQHTHHQQCLRQHAFLKHTHTQIQQNFNKRLIFIYFELFSGWIFYPVLNILLFALHNLISAHSYNEFQNLHFVLYSVQLQILK